MGAVRRMKKTPTAGQRAAAHAAAGVVQEENADADAARARPTAILPHPSLPLPAEAPPPGPVKRVLADRIPVMRAHEAEEEHDVEERGAVQEALNAVPRHALAPIGPAGAAASPARRSFARAKKSRLPDPVTPPAPPPVPTSDLPVDHEGKVALYHEAPMGGAQARAGDAILKRGVLPPAGDSGRVKLHESGLAHTLAEERNLVRVDPGLLDPPTVDKHGNREYSVDLARHGLETLPVTLGRAGAERGARGTIDPALRPVAKALEQSLGTVPILAKPAKPDGAVATLTANTGRLMDLDPATAVAPGITAGQLHVPDSPAAWQLSIAARVGTKDARAWQPFTPDRLLEYRRDPDTLKRFLAAADPTVRAGIGRMLGTRDQIDALRKGRGIPAPLLANLYVWGRLTAAMTPSAHDAALARLMATILPHFRAKSLAGRFDDRDAAEWRSEIQGLRLFRGSYAANAQMNAAKHAATKTDVADLLKRWGAPMPDGQQNYWQRLHTLVNDPAMTGRDLRRQVHAEGFLGGVGLGNKTFGLATLFTGLHTTAMDRINAIHFFPHAVSQMRASGITKEDAGNNVLNPLFDGVRGLAGYEAYEDILGALAPIIHQEGLIARPDDIGGAHCALWTLNGQKEVDHGVLDGMAEIARQGLYGTPTETTLGRTPFQAMTRPTASEFLERKQIRNVVEGRPNKNEGRVERSGYLAPESLAGQVHSLHLGDAGDALAGLGADREKALRDLMHKHGYAIDFGGDAEGRHPFIVPQTAAAAERLKRNPHAVFGTLAHHLGGYEYHAHRLLDPDAHPDAPRGLHLPTTTPPSHRAVRAVNFALADRFPDRRIRATVAADGAVQVHDYRGGHVAGEALDAVLNELAKRGIIEGTADAPAALTETAAEVHHGRPEPLLKARDSRDARWRPLHPAPHDGRRISRIGAPGSAYRRAFRKAAAGASGAVSRRADTAAAVAPPFAHPRVSHIQLRPLTADELRWHVARERAMPHLYKAYTQPPLFNTDAYQPHPHEALAQQMNQRDWFHGSGTGGLSPEKLDVMKTTPYNVYGRGVYLTGSPRVAAQFAKMGHGPQEPEDAYDGGYGEGENGEQDDGEEADADVWPESTVYHARTSFKKLLPLDEPAPDHVRQAFLNQVGDDWGDEEEGDEDGGSIDRRLARDPETTSNDLYQRLHAIDYDNEDPSLVDSMNNDLHYGHGYDGLHTYADNGWRTGHAHMVVAFHDPPTRIPTFAPHTKSFARWRKSWIPLNATPRPKRTGFEPIDYGEAPENPVSHVSMIINPANNGFARHLFNPPLEHHTAFGDTSDADMRRLEAASAREGGIRTHVPDNPDTRWAGYNGKALTAAPAASEAVSESRQSVNDGSADQAEQERRRFTKPLRAYDPAVPETLNESNSRRQLTNQIFHVVRKNDLPDHHVVRHVWRGPDSPTMPMTLQEYRNLHGDLDLVPAAGGGHVEIENNQPHYRHEDLIFPHRDIIPHLPENYSRQQYYQQLDKHLRGRFGYDGFPLEEIAGMAQRPLADLEAQQRVYRHQGKPGYQNRLGRWREGHPMDAFSGKYDDDGAEIMPKSWHSPTRRFYRRA